MITQDEMNVLVPQKLREIEAEHGVKVLQSSERGSRAWGFASPDSDFDVRFVYIRPRNDYLRLSLPRDVIEMPIDDTWDVSGWDLHKALRLLSKSNPSLYECFASGIRYVDTGFARRFAPLLQEYYEKKAMMYHYYHMAENNIRVFLKGEKIRPKKYFYALRPILACFWVRDNDSPPPILYADLVEAQMPASLCPVNDVLLDLKVNGPEKEEIAPIAEVDAFIGESMRTLGDILRALPNYEPKPAEPLDRFFLSELDRLEGV